MLAVKNNVSVRQYVPPFGTPNTPVSLDTGETSAVYPVGIENELKGFPLNPTGVMQMPNLVSVDPFQIPRSNGPAVGPGVILTQTLLDQKNAVTDDGTPLNPQAVAIASVISTYRGLKADMNATAKNSGSNNYENSDPPSRRGSDPDDPDDGPPSTGEPILRQRDDRRRGIVVPFKPVEGVISRQRQVVGGRETPFGNPYSKRMIQSNIPTLVGPQNKPPERPRSRMISAARGGGGAQPTTSIMESPRMDVDYSPNQVVLEYPELAKAPTYINPLPPGTAPELSIAAQAAKEARERGRRLGEKTIEQIMKERRIRKEIADKARSSRSRTRERPARSRTPATRQEDMVDEKMDIDEDIDANTPNIDQTQLALVQRRLIQRLLKKRKGLPQRSGDRKRSKSITAPPERPMLEGPEDDSPGVVDLALQDIASTPPRRTLERFIRLFVNQERGFSVRSIRDILMQEANYRGRASSFDDYFNENLANNRPYLYRAIIRLLNQRELQDVNDIR